MPNLYNNKKLLKSIFKIVLAFIALTVVFSKVELKQVQSIVTHANGWYLLLAFFFFNLSKMLSSRRLNIYFQHIGVTISELYALKLYYIGMFYNLFLPGGIGGDGYKIYLLKKSHHAEIKTLISATLIDRLSGLVPLLFFAGVLFIQSDFYHKYILVDWLVLTGTALIFPLFYFFNLLFFKRYIPLFLKTTLMGSVVQLLQLISAFFIIKAIGYESHMTLFLTLFLISSVIAVLPISIGGIGLRELTFLYGLGLLGLNPDGGVTFSLLFFLITAFASLIGVFLRDKPY